MEDEWQLDFQLLCTYHYQRFQLKTLHAIVEGVTTRLAGRQEMQAPNLGYRSGAYHKPTWVPFQVSRASQPVPSQDADVLVSGHDGPSYVDSRKFPEADLSDCDDAQELSVGSLGDVQLRACRDTGLLTCVRAAGVVDVGLAAGWLPLITIHPCLLARGCLALSLSLLLWILSWSLPKSFLLS